MTRHRILTTTRQTTIIAPVVHLNGTSRTELQDQWTAALDALERAAQALATASPHARDYYPQGNDASLLAAAQHRHRLEAIAGVLDDARTILTDLNA